MPYALTELEKTILLSFLVTSRGDLKKFVPRETIVPRFKVRQRRMVASFLDRLVRKKMLERHDSRYRLTGEGLGIAQGLLATGAGLWYYTEQGERQ